MVGKLPEECRTQDNSRQSSPSIPTVLEDFERLIEVFSGDLANLEGAMEPFLKPNPEEAIANKSLGEEPNETSPINNEIQRLHFRMANLRRRVLDLYSRIDL